MTDLTESDARFGHGLPDESTDEDKRLLVDFRVRSYKSRRHWKADTLAECSADDFARFSPDDFKLLNGDFRRELRDLLRNCGVYVPKGRGVLLPDGLYAFVKENFPCPTRGDGEEQDHDEKQPRVNSARDASISSGRT